jgi:hypothetical protein
MCFEKKIEQNVWQRLTFPAAILPPAHITEFAIIGIENNLISKLSAS